MRMMNGGIQWNLLPGRGVYNFVDIEGAVNNGYNINFIGKCLIYDKIIDNLFSDFIRFWYNVKSAEDLKPEEDRNVAKRNIAKLFMNCLYGKILQKPSFETETITNNIDDVYGFLEKNELLKIEILGKNKMLIKGETKQQFRNEVISKPAQLVSFVLSNSRNIMLFYNKLIDPSLKNIFVSYTDTDSLHVPAEVYFRLKQIGYIRNGELGHLSNDIKKNGMIFYEKNLGSKLYMYKYINDNNEIRTIMKCKGLHKKYLKEEFYENESGEIEINKSIKKIYNPTKRETEDGISKFDLIYKTLTRKFNYNPYSGRELIGNYYYPVGFNKNKYKLISNFN